MSNPVTIDASVLVNAFSPTEAGSEHSWQFLTELRESETPIIVPTLLLAEVVASIARKQNNTELALNWMLEIQRIPNITFVSIDESIAETAAEIAARHRLRGSDAVYAAVAKRFSSALITLDKEQLERVKKVVPVRRP
jgi:predicted nucleic acid-binding protein